VIANGIFFQRDRRGLVRADVSALLRPIAIILVGLALLTRPGSRGDGDDDETVSSGVIWWGSEGRTRSQNFRGGSPSAFMRGIAVDLRRAGLADRADISVFVSWGGVEINAPPTSRVRVSGLPLTGGRAVGRRRAKPA